MPIEGAHAHTRRDTLDQYASRYDTGDTNAPSPVTQRSDSNSATTTTTEIIATAMHASPTGSRQRWFKHTAWQWWGVSTQPRQGMCRRDRLGSQRHRKHASQAITSANTHSDN